MERPRIREVVNKQEIIKLVEKAKEQYPDDYKRCDEVAPFLIPMIELTYQMNNETYAKINLLQREVEYYKQLIDYDALCEKVDNDMKYLGLKRN